MNSLQKTSVQIRNVKKNINTFTILFSNKEPLVVVEPSTFGIGKLQLGIQGSHQYYNAALAIAMCKTWIEKTGGKIKGKTPSWSELPVEFIQGLQETYWPGRSQQITFSDNITFFLDGAHTIESMEACSIWWNSLDHSQVSRVLLFNCHHSRNPKKLLPVWAQQAETFDLAIFSTNETEFLDRILEDKREEKPQGTSWQENLYSTWKSLLEEKHQLLIQKASIVESIPKAISAIQQHQHQIGKRVHVLATGSLYLVGALLELLKPEMRDKLQ